MEMRILCTLSEIKSTLDLNDAEHNKIYKNKKYHLNSWSRFCVHRQIVENCIDDCTGNIEYSLTLDEARDFGLIKDSSPAIG
jgi:hypothetical protein